MESFLVSTGIVALAEIGDKTQLLAFILAAKFRRPVPIIVGILLATIANHGFAGALGAMFIVFGLAHGDGSWTQTRLLLTGVIVAAGCGALVALMLAIAEEHKLRGMLFWLMGDLGQSTQWWPPLAALVVALTLAMPFARELNLLSRGMMQAQALGVAVGRLRYAI